MNKRRNVIILTSLICIMALLSGCFIGDEPPSAEKVQKWLTKHQQDIDTVVDYLTSLECDEAFIRDFPENPSVFYEFDWHEISSKEAKKSLFRLWLAGCRWISRYDAQGQNTIYFALWYRAVGSRDCGIARIIDGQGVPKTDCQTYSEEISGGWYYCYNDYEEYRCDPSAYPNAIF